MQLLDDLAMWSDKKPYSKLNAADQAKIRNMAARGQARAPAAASPAPTTSNPAPAPPAAIPPAPPPDAMSNAGILNILRRKIGEAGSQAERDAATRELEDYLQSGPETAEIPAHLAKNRRALAASRALKAQLDMNNPTLTSPEQQ
jgi:hypothetical protein